jgi:dTDP-glucose 4,6-dehydratase
MNISKISSELGWQPSSSLSEGLLITALWYIEHQDWVDSIREKGDYQTWITQNYDERGGTE